MTLTNKVPLTTVVDVLERALQELEERASENNAMLIDAGNLNDIVRNTLIGLGDPAERKVFLRELREVNYGTYLPENQD